MSLLSANTLFHFTPRDFILDKFERGFVPRLLTEFDPELDSGFFNDTGKVYIEDQLVPNADRRALYVPMVCFCDTPMSSLRKHMDVYSSYGIGMAKDWGIQKGLNPVMYVNTNSYFFSNLTGPLRFLEFLEPVIRNRLNKSKTLDLGQEFTDMAGLTGSLYQYMSMLRDTFHCYLKPYVCKGLYRGKHANYSYYDEKEWRYSPVFSSDVSLNPIHSLLSKKEIDDLNEKISVHSLNFLPENVKYIIVNDDSDVSYIINGLHDIKDRTKKYTDEDIYNLSAKIITRKSIEEDF